MYFLYLYKGQTYIQPLKWHHFCFKKFFCVPFQSSISFFVLHKDARLIGDPILIKKSYLLKFLRPETATVCTTWSLM